MGEVQKAFSDDTTKEDFMKVYGVSKPDKDHYLIFSCRTGRRSQMAIDQVVPLGYSK